MTDGELITEAAIMAGIAAIGETLDGGTADYGLSKLNQMVDMWAADRLAIYRTQRVSGLNLVSGTASYTIGAGATWNVARPSWIDGAGVIVDPSATYPVELAIEVFTNKQWQEIPSKTIQSALPMGIWYDRTFTTEFGTIYVYPILNTSTPDIVLYLPIAVTEFDDLVTDIVLPPGYRMAMVSNLSVLMCAGLREVPGAVAAIAAMSLGQLKSVNLVAQMDALECDGAVLNVRGAAFNYYTGGVR